MHILRPPFRMEDAAAVEFAARRGFGLVAASERGELMASHVPFVVRLHEGVVTVEFHVTAANPLACLAEAGARFLVAVSGADAYVSNDWYASPDQVSTWALKRNNCSRFSILVKLRISRLRAFAGRR